MMSLNEPTAGSGAVPFRFHIPRLSRTFLRPRTGALRRYKERRQHREAQGEAFGCDSPCVNGSATAAVRRRYVGGTVAAGEERRDYGRGVAVKNWLPFWLATNAPHR